MDKKITQSKPTSPYVYGESFVNPYLGSKFTEVLRVTTRTRVGWVWVHRDGRVVIAPHLGVYVWYNEQGNPWTAKEGALWLVGHKYAAL